MKHAVMLGMLAGLGMLSVPAFADMDKGEAAVRASLGEVQPDRIRPAAVEGLYEVVIGPHVFYVSADGRHMLQGDLVELANGRNLTQPQREAALRETIEGIGEENMLVFSPEETRHTITVFTDIDCGYCRKLHHELADYHARGIRIRYLMFPRSGIGSPSYDKAVSVWCAEDRNESLTRAKNGKDPAARKCANPVQRHMELGQNIGVRGTPSIVFEDGRVLPGYVPAARMAAMLEANPAP
jgi:thiol:disulfide interchange protein DsbC